MNNSHTMTRKQSFSYRAPTAQSVQLVGDFTDWEKNPIQLRKHGQVWQASVELEPGPHRYRFLVDREWQDDPECHVFVNNPFGSHDSLREVA